MERTNPGEPLLVRIINFSSPVACVIHVYSLILLESPMKPRRGTEIVDNVENGSK